MRLDDALALVRPVLLISSVQVTSKRSGFPILLRALQSDLNALMFSPLKIKTGID